MRIGIVGVSGYGGSELLRLCIGHPSFEVVYASGESTVEIAANYLKTLPPDGYNILYTASSTVVTGPLIALAIPSLCAGWIAIEPLLYGSSTGISALAILVSAVFWAALWKIIIANIILSGDNAVVIAMACHNLSDKYRRPAIMFGSAGAIVLRIVFCAVIGIRG